MPSKALESLKKALTEVGDLERGNPSQYGKKPVDPPLTRVIGRASIVLLASHYERYIHAVNEEAAEHINVAKISGKQIPVELRLLHAKPAIDQLSEIQWDNRGSKLGELMKTDAWLWDELGAPGQVLHERFLLWMKSPKPENVQRFYRYWAIGHFPSHHG